MFTIQKLSKTTLGAALISLSTIAPAAAASFYSVTGLPFLPSDINDIGQIVGENYLWNKGNLTDLSTLPGSGTSRFYANAINNNGLIVGDRGFIYYVSEKAFLSDGTTIKDLKLSNYRYTTATDINDADQIVLLGGNDSPFFGPSAFLQDSDGTTTTRLSYVSDVLNAAINNVGQVIGTRIGRGRSGPSIGIFENNGNGTLLSSPGYCFDLAPRYRCSPENPFSAGVNTTDINDIGQVVGRGPINRNLYSPVHAILWNDPENNPIGADLGTLGGDSQALGINNASQIVGNSYKSSNALHAFLWEEGTMFDLNNLIASDLGWQLSSALKINNKGEIIGTGFFNGQQRGFLLTPTSAPVPEPTSALSLLGFGAVGIGVLLKRQQQQKKIV